MEIYDQLGISDVIFRAFVPVATFTPGFERRTLRGIPIGSLGVAVTPYPRLYVVEQSRNVQILYRHLLFLGGEVLWGHRLKILIVADYELRLPVRATMDVVADAATTDERFRAGVRLLGEKLPTSPRRLRNSPRLCLIGTSSRSPSDRDSSERRSQGTSSARSRMMRR